MAQKIMLAFFIGISCISIHAMEQSKDSNLMILQQSIRQLEIEQTNLVNTIIQSPDKSETTDQWAQLLKNSGKLEYFIKLGVIKNKREKKNVMRSLRHLDAAFKNHVTVEMKQAAVEALQNNQN